MPKQQDQSGNPRLQKCCNLEVDLCKGGGQVGLDFCVALGLSGIGTVVKLPNRITRGRGGHVSYGILGHLSLHAITS